jgi:hypothetical protein
MVKRSTRALLVALAVTAMLLSLQAQALASSRASTAGGGVVGGPLGVTSQLGMSATAAGGEFLCIMAGRSGGFAFGPWASVTQMQVQGPVTAGTLTITGSSSSFRGTATVRVTGKTASGGVLAMTFADVPYTSSQGAGGAGVGWHRLQIPMFGIDTGASLLAAGRISITQ